MDTGFLRKKIMKKLFAAAVIAIVLCFTASMQTSVDTRTRTVGQTDGQNRDKNGKLITLPVAEHIKRGFEFLDNRHFPEAREHFQRVLDVYPNDPLLPRALFGLARAFMWEKRYASAIPLFVRVSTEFPDTKDGREGLNYLGACHVRISKFEDAARIYGRYATLYPTGERIENAYLNSIDALREAGKYTDAIQWVEKAKVRFAGLPAAVNAMQARVRMEIFRQNWADAVTSANELLTITNFTGSMVTAGEVKYLKGIALESAGKRSEAMAVYGSIPDANGNYWGGLASDKISAVSRVRRTAQITSASTTDFPVVFRTEVLQNAKSRGIDPRFVLAIMKQESSFRPGVTSPSAARGLMQLVYDTAAKYNVRAGYPTFTDEDLFKPAVNIAIGTTYIADLKEMFNGLNEAMAASYNGGEDNVTRWLSRTKPKDPGVFTAEIGFPETKVYVFKVMTNYRMYSALYDENLVKK